MATQQGIESPVTLPAAGDISAHQFRFMTLSSGQVTTQTVSGADCIAVLQNKPSAAGQAAELILIGKGGIAKVVAGAATTASAKLQSDGEGRAIDALSGDHVLATGIEAATAAGQIIEVVLGSSHLLV